MNEKNITTLTEALERLGFARLEQEVRLNIYLGADNFTVSHKDERAGDKLHSVFYFMRKEDGNYSCTHYDATLRVKLIIDADAEAAALEKQMQPISWEVVSDPGHDTAIVWPEVEAVLRRMEEVSQLPDGAEVTNLLKMKFWMDTKLEGFIPNLSTLKNQYETTQRFHFFDDDGGISLNEAYRFLSHRWKEKQLNRNRKMQVMESLRDAAPASSKLSKKGGKGARNKVE
jgi:hypothetical protein